MGWVTFRKSSRVQEQRYKTVVEFNRIHNIDVFNNLVKELI